MFDMLTADAASKHGHEFSPAQATARWLAPRRVSPFKALRQTQPSQSSQASQPIVHKPLKEAPRKSLRSEISVSDLHIPGAFRSNTPSPTPSIILEEPKTRAPSVSTSVPQSPTITAKSEEIESSSEKHCRRSKLRYEFGHPPPLPSSRRQNKAKIQTLLQLQTKSSSGFHRPVYDVDPLDFTTESSALKNRLRRRYTTYTNGVIVSRSCQYGMEDDIGDSASRDVLGVVTDFSTEEDGRKSAQIIADDMNYTIIQRRNRTYDLIINGETSPKARWYIPERMRRNSLGQDYKFFLAYMSSNSTKHPTIASMTSKHLDVYDNYKPVEELESLPVDEFMNKLILLSSIWVASCEKWAPYIWSTIESSIQSTISSKRSSSISSIDLMSISKSFSGTTTVIDETPEPEQIPTVECLSLELVKPATVSPRQSVLDILVTTKTEDQKAIIEKTDRPMDIVEKADEQQVTVMEQIDEQEQITITEESKCVPNDVVNSSTIIQDDPTTQFKQLLSLTNKVNAQPGRLSKIRNFVGRNSSLRSSSPNRWRRRVTLQHIPQIDSVTSLAVSEPGTIEIHSRQEENDEKLASTPTIMSVNNTTRSTTPFTIGTSRPLTPTDDIRPASAATLHPGVSAPYWQAFNALQPRAFDHQLDESDGTYPSSPPFSTMNKTNSPKKTLAGRWLQRISTFKKN